MNAARPYHCVWFFGRISSVLLAVTALAAQDTPPTVAIPAVAVPSVVASTTAKLTVTGADDGGATALVYSWSATGPSPVTFSAAGTNAAKSVTATFKAPGNYVCTATIKDTANQTVTSDIAVQVAETLSTLSISPTSAVVNPESTKQFMASAKNQFGVIIPGQPLTWTLTGPGVLDANGLYSAAGVVPGSATVVVSTGGKTAQAPIRINASPSVSLNPISDVSATSVTIAAVGADPDDALTALKYTWSASGPKTVSFSPNGSNASIATKATFSAAG